MTATSLCVLRKTFQSLSPVPKTLETPAHVEEKVGHCTAEGLSPLHQCQRARFLIESSTRQ